MNERRTSIGNRVLSLVLALVMVIGLLPLSAFSVSAADSATAGNLAKIKTYASSLLNTNFDKTMIENGTLNWDTEGNKGDSWRYYNGLMLDAMLTLGVDSDKGNALEFAKDFMDVNISSSGGINKWHAGELDSVPPAFTLFALLDTAEVDDATRANYVKAINYVYGQLEAQTSYSNCGGNFLHKDNWTSYQIGLDGLYMAQPFLMLYANALEAGTITNTVNSKTAGDIYKEVYDRLVWVADNMQDSTTGLYHHGWNVNDSRGNGHFWSRAIGWYAAALVICAEKMPAGEYKNGLIGKMTKLFDPMLTYQDSATGLWYNVVNRDASLTDNNGNKLETSGTALMSFALLKAYNNGWVTDAKYATAGEKAFNGIVANKLSSDGKTISDTYKSSGVCNDDASYCKNSYVSNEAKGVGGVLMAAAEVDEYLGNREQFAVGVVVAPADMTVVKGAPINTANIKVSLLGGQGSIAKNVADQVHYEVGEADANGKATVTVTNGSATIGTFTVTVIDPATPATGTGKLPVETEVTDVPTAPAVTAGDWVAVAATSGDGYILVAAPTPGKEYVLTNKTSSSTAGTATVNGTSFGGTKVDTRTNTNGVYPLSSGSNAKPCHWLVDSEGRIYTVIDGTNYYVKFTGISSSNKELVSDATAASVFSFSATGVDVSATTTVNGTTVYMQIDGSGMRPYRSSKQIYLFEKQSSASKYAMLSGTATYAFPVGTATDILAQIKNDYTIYSNATGTGNGTSEEVVAWNDGSVTTAWDKALDASTAGTYTLTVSVDGKEIGKIPVLVYGNTVIEYHDVTLSVTPGAIVANVGETVSQLQAVVTVAGLEGVGYTVSYSGGDASVATVTEAGVVTVVGAGTTSITATVTGITYGGKTYTSADFGEIKAVISVTVNAEAQEVSYSLTGLTVLPGSITAGGTAQANATAAASDASGNHSYTYSYSLSGTGVSINASTGAITTTSAASGEYTVTATLTAVDGKTDFVKGNVTKTAKFTVNAAADYEYTVKGSDGTSLAGKNITLNKGETFTPTFSVMLGGEDKTSGYTMVLTSSSTAITINGTTITANQVSEDTVANVTATVTRNSKARATADGTSVDFTVTVKASAATGTGNVTTTQPGSGSGTTIGGVINGAAPDGFTFGGTYASTTITYGGETTSKPLKFNSSGKVTFTATDAGKLTLVFAGRNAGNEIKIDDEVIILAVTDGVCVVERDLTAGAHTIVRSSGESQLGFIYYATSSGSGSDITTHYNASLNVTPGSLNLTAKDVATLAGTVSAVLASDNSAATVDSYTITWTSGNGAVATVDASGNVTAVAAGSTTITAKVTAIKVNGLDGTINNDEALTVSIPVTVTASSTGSGSIVHNFTTDGKTNDFFTITGNLSTDKGSTSYNGKTLTQCLKMESSTTVTFTAPTDGTLTLVFGAKEAGKNVSINGVNYTTDSNGIVTASVTAGTSYSIKKTDSINLFYMEYAPTASSFLTLNNPPMLYVGGEPNQATLADYVSSVKYNGAEVTDYEIQWSVVDGAIASVENGVVTAKAGGRTQLIAKLVKVNGADVSAENITAEADLVVTAPEIDLGEDLSKFVGDTFTLDPQVRFGDTPVGSFELSWTISGDAGVLAREGTNFTVTGAGTATITATLTMLDGHSTEPISASITVTAEDVVVNRAELSQDTVTVNLNASKEDIRKALSAISLNLFQNNGKTDVVSGDLLFATANLDAVNTGSVGTYPVDVIYTAGDYTFNGIVNVKVIDPTVLNGEGIISEETNVTYVIDTNGIDNNEEYVIVIQGADGKWYALMNPDASNNSNVKGTSQEVVRIEDGAKITISENADLVEWQFASRSETTSNGVTFVTFKLSNNNRVVRQGNNSILGSSAGTAYTNQNGDTYFIGLGSASSGKFYALLRADDGSWSRTSNRVAIDDAAAPYYYLYKRVSETQDKGVGFGVAPETLEMVDGNAFTVSDIRVQVDGANTDSYTIEWKSSNETVATVDANGKITAVGEGTATITATLVTANGAQVINATTSAVGISKDIAVTVKADHPTYVLQNGHITVPKGGKPDFSKVSLLIDSSLGDQYDSVIPSNELLIKYIDAIAAGLDTNVPGEYTVDVSYGDKWNGQIRLTVSDNPYGGLEPATDYPQYPDPGAVRLNKFATRVNFTKTGIVKIELNAAGISTRTPVDVVLIVDVSNSMGWSMDWFVGKTEDEVNQAGDSAKVDTSKDDKLDYAMQAAQEFAAILFGNNAAGSDKNNTMTFVTFGGNDLERGGNTANMDSVLTAFVGEDDLAKVNNSFSNTKFTSYSSGKYGLQIAGTDGKAIASGTSRGNTIYDFAFLEAIDAVNALKVAKGGSVEAYDASGRQVHVVFMTDGAPSHYNDKRYDNTNDSGNRFSSFSGTETEWLEYVKNYNEDATNLYSMVNDFHIVGFDLAHGGFGSHSWEEADLGRVLGGLVKNKALDYTLAGDTDKLNTFFNELGHSLVYAGTNALVTDLVSTNFTLQTKGFDTNEDGVVDQDAVIQILERQLVVASDIGKTLSIGGVDTVINETHLGMVVDGGEEVLATVTLDGDNYTAYSTALNESVDIWDGDDQTGTITGKYFTYDFATKTFRWNIGNIEDTELALTYYAYLDGSLEGTLEKGIYPTNEQATLKYVDTGNKVVEREYPVPQVTWGKAAVTVRFYLVNENGQFVNRAGHTFTNPANRIFLNGRAYYTAALNGQITFTAADALMNANLEGNTVLYDPSMQITVKNDLTGSNLGYISWDVVNEALANIGNLQIATDNSNGLYTAAFVDIPVVMTDLGESKEKMHDSNVVIDFSNTVRWNTLHQREQEANGVEYTDENGNVLRYTIELVGLAPYNPGADLKDYIAEAAWPTTLDTAAGTYEIVPGSWDVKFTPKSVLNGTDKVFGVYKFVGEPVDGTTTENYFYMYKLISVVPATVVHYETTDNMRDAFETNGSWTVATSGAKAGEAQSNVNGNYGYDDSYTACSNMAGGSALFINNTNPRATRPTVKFTFTGTGIDIISKTGANQGRIKMILTGKNTGTTKTVTVLNKGVDELWQIPVLSVEGLPYDTYAVEIIVYGAPFDGAYGGEFYFDAINVYGSAEETEVAGSDANTTVGSLYEVAGESKPQLINIRQILLGNNDFGTGVEGVSGAVYIDGNTTLGEGSSHFNDYDKIGPNNEVYLSNNQAVAFKLKVSDLAKLPASLGIGLKSVNGSEAMARISVYKVGETDTTPAVYTVTSATSMFYDILGGETIQAFLGESNDEFYVVISNVGTGLLSVTDLKIGYGVEKGNVDTVVDIDTGDVAQDTLKASAEVVSVTAANEKTDDQGNKSYSAYALYTTTLVVVTGQDAKSVKITDAEGNEIGAAASYVDGENGARRWRVLVRFGTIGDGQVFTVTGIGSNGQAHETTQNITMDVQYYVPQSATESIN